MASREGMTTDPKFRLILGNCLDVMRSWPDDHVDLIVCSPPYEDARTYGIDFKVKGQEWVDWMLPICAEASRVCKGLVIVNCEGRTEQFRWSATPVLLMADLHRAGFNLRKPPLYVRHGIPGSGSVDWLKNRYEFCIAITKPGKLPWSDNTACGWVPGYGPGGAPSHRGKDGKRANRSFTEQTRRKSDGTRGKRERTGYMHSERKTDGRLIQRRYDSPPLSNPGNIIEDDDDEMPDALIDCGAETDFGIGNENEAPFHPKLANFFIRSFCPPGGVVCDIFSGTTGQEAIRNGRNYIGIDLRQSQIDLSRRRCQAARQGIGFGLHIQGTNE
jgi:hypothetical protein